MTSFAGGMMIDLLREPGLEQFVQSDPRIARLLRPLWHMLGIPERHIPDYLRPAPKPLVEPAPSVVTDQPDQPAFSAAPTADAIDPACFDNDARTLPRLE